jgi:hypothetical protein
MYSLKPGRGPSFMGGIGALGAAVFGIFWTIMAFQITRDAPFPLVGTIFPLFGVVFVITGIAMAIYNFSNASRQNRNSAFDITSAREEPDPLNQIFGSPASTSTKTEDRLRDLEELRKKSLITEAEYTEQRRRILAEL